MSNSTCASAHALSIRAVRPADRSFSNDSSSSCVSFPSNAYLVSGPSSLSRTRIASTAFVTRNASKLYLDGSEFRAVGPNIYWLGLDENINNTISYPTQGRVREIMATAAAMGASVVRSHTLGSSIGHPLTIWPSLNSTNEEALTHIDYAIAVAREWGIRLVIPLVDNYDYYHGGTATFLGWRNLSTSDKGLFYSDLDVRQDFKTYIGTILNRTNTYTNVSYSADPTILAWETGNELSSPPAAWTSDITSFIKALAPNHLTIDGSYGIQSDALPLETVDIYSNHYYPVVRRKLDSNAAEAARAGKAFYAGEFDWTDKYKNYAYFACLIPLIFVGIAFCLPGRWFPWSVPLPTFSKRSRKRGNAEGSTPLKANFSPLNQTTFEDDTDAASLKTPAFPRSGSTSTSFSSSPLHTTSFGNTYASSPPSSTRTRFYIRKWMFALSFLLLCPIAAIIAWQVGPTSLNQFLNSVEKSPAIGDAYWSLFGRDDNCCRWVEHNDGFTLHYRSDGQMKQSLSLTRHAYDTTGLQAAFSLRSESDLPVVACPQPEMTF